MPDGLRCYHHSRQSHFVAFTCYHRLPQLNTGEIRDVVVEELEHARVAYRFRVYGFVVMPDHVHLLLSEPERATLAQVTQSMKIASAKRNAAFRKPGAPLWQKRYYDCNIRDHDLLVEKLDYIHENPVRRSLCAWPKDRLMPCAVA
jgi:putative transposase